MNRNDGARGDARKARESARQEAGAGDVEALAELVSWATGEFTRWSADAHPDHNRWSWRGDGHGLPSEDSLIREYVRDIARTLTASDWLARVIADAKAEALREVASEWSSLRRDALLFDYGRWIDTAVQMLHERIEAAR